MRQRITLTIAWNSTLLLRQAKGLQPSSFCADRDRLHFVGWLTIRRILNVLETVFGQPSGINCIHLKIPIHNTRVGHQAAKRGPFWDNQSHQNTLHRGPLVTEGPHHQ